MVWSHHIPTRSRYPLQVIASPAECEVKRESSMRLALVIAAAHALNDAYMSFVPPLLPRIMDDLDLSITLVATLAVTFSVAGSLPQPLFGYLADRCGRRAFAVLGPVVSGVFVAVMGWAGGFWTLTLLLTFAGLGSAAFHPPGASYAVRASEGKGGGGRYSIFAFGGAAGFALGPLAGVGLVQSRGMTGLWVAMLPVVLLAPLIYLGLPSDDTAASVRSRPLPPPPHQVVRHLRGPLGLIFGVSATMAFMQRSFLTMEPIIVADSGGSEILGAVVLAAYLGAQAFGTVAGGVLADRVNVRLLLANLCFWAVPAHLLAVWIGPQGTVGLIAAGMAGFLGMATVPPIVVMAQEMMPTGTAVSSGIVMGLAWATGSIGVLAIGALGDVIGPQAATLVAMPAGLFALGLALRIPGGDPNAVSPGAPS